MPNSTMCSKCGKEPRQGAHRWGKACRAETRIKGRVVTALPQPTVTPDGTADGAGGNAVTPCGLCSGKDAMIFSLTSEVQTLKAEAVLLRATIRKLKQAEKRTVVGSRGPLSVKAAKETDNPAKRLAEQIAAKYVSPYSSRIYDRSTR